MKGDGVDLYGKNTNKGGGNKPPQATKGGAKGHPKAPGK